MNRNIPHSELHQLLDDRYKRYCTPEFVQTDPIQVPHAFTRKEDIEIAGFLAAMNPVLEAKLVTSNGLSISLCTEWIVNPREEEYHKQDCESKAFKRLALRLKDYFPRLPICFVFDGLYCTQTVMDICRDNQWQWICVFKDGNLPRVHQELSLLPDSAFSKTIRLMPHKKTAMDFGWCNNLDYNGHMAHWMECNQETALGNERVEKHHFEYLTSIAQCGQLVDQCVEAARDRWHIEDSFNDQKNRGFSMQHLFSRSSFQAFCNWYQCLQLAHTIYQFVIKSREFCQLLDQHSKLTICYIWEKTLCVMTCKKLKKFIRQFDQWAVQPRQMRWC